MPKLSSYTTKATPTTSDLLPISDAAASNATKNVTAGSLPISTATQTALDLKAPLASPTFTGSVTLNNVTGDIPSDTTSAFHLEGSAAGTAAAPTYAFLGDVDTGVFRAAANELGFSTAGTERARIDSSGTLLVGKTSAVSSTKGVYVQESGVAVFVTDGARPIILNRLTDDGDLMSFRQANTEEGTISVSGTTVSYNGAHLSRWSQLTEAGRPEILRGTIMSNLDEMCVWDIEAQDAVLWTEEDELPEGVEVGDIKTPAVETGVEANEQLNKTKISDVQGDKNVAGVFQGWDNDDEGNDDFYVAMTGDFVIRIGAGVTVERGDLIQSAGDGTGEPQDDDIVRSKTVAKVTSTNVTCTYEDGSYCVPCVLMAC